MAILFTSLLGSAAALLVYTLYDLNQRAYIRETNALVTGQAKHYQRILAELSPQARIDKVSQDAKADAQKLLALLGINRSVVAGTLAALPSRSELTYLRADLFSFPLTAAMTSNATSQRERMPVMAARVLHLPGGQQLWVGHDISAIRQGYRSVNLLSAFILLFLIIVVLTSFFISTIVVRRINSIANTAQRIIETGDLSQRIIVESTWDDLGNLAELLNISLARIEQLMQAVRDVTDNIAHDLRTPLTRLRNRLEAGRSRLQKAALSGEDAQSTNVLVEDFDALLAEADQLLGVFNAILRLSNLEQGHRSQPFVKVQLHEILTDVIELYQPLAEDKRIQLFVDEMANVVRPGDPNLLFQVLANTLDNAIKFTPAGGDIHVSLVLLADASQDQCCCITIADSGCGIVAQELDKVFDRFFRSDRSRHLPGSGLGLSLVRAVVELHGGRVCLEDNTPGLKCLIYL